MVRIEEITIPDDVPYFALWNRHVNLHHFSGATSKRVSPRIIGIPMSFQDLR